MKKYEFTGETLEHYGITLWRIRRIDTRELGGWLESEDNLSQEGDCWVSEEAKVFDNAKVYDNALVYGNAIVYDNAQIFNNALVYGNAIVFGNAEVFGNARVFDNAWVYNYAKVYENARVCGNAQVYAYASVYNCASVLNDAKVFGDAEVFDNAWVYNYAQVSGNVRVYNNAKVYGNAKVYDNAQVSGNVRVYNNAKVYGNTQIAHNIHLQSGTWEETPLFIQGSRDSMNMCTPELLKIGCEEHTLEHWLEHYQEIGEANKYTQAQIEEYYRHIQTFAKHYLIKTQNQTEEKLVMMLHEIPDNQLEKKWQRACWPSDIYVTIENSCHGSKLIWGGGTIYKPTWGDVKATDWQEWEPTEPKTIDIWINVYKSNTSLEKVQTYGNYRTKEQADLAAGRDCIDCIKVTIPNPYYKSSDKDNK